MIRQGRMGCMSNTKQAQDAVSAWRERLSMVDTSAGQIAVLDTGEGTPVVMLHGIPLSAYVWRDVVPIVAHNQRVIAPDLAGFGFSDTRDDTDLSPQGQVSLIEEVLGALNIDTFALVGHDYGALVACELVARAPERVTRLVLTNTSLRTDDWWAHNPLNPLAILKVPGAGEAALKVARPFMLKQAFRFYVDNKERIDGDALAVYWHPFRTGFDRTLLRLARESQLDDDTFHAWKAALYDYKGQALVVWGGNDPTFRQDRAHEIVRSLSNCRYELFVHSNHFIQEDRPVALGRLVASFAEGRLDE